MTGPQAALLSDGRRLHLQHGPIDLVIEAFGARGEVAAAYRQARERFADILPVLVEELAALRLPVREPRWKPAGPVARRMMNAVWPHRGVFVTPMAAVAGSVADEMMDAAVAGRTLEKAYVNNSGDISVHLEPGASLRLGIVGEIMRAEIDGMALLSHDRPVRGVATSGWQGRSWSFGIADAVTVLAETAAAADVAATLIANAVTVDHPAIERAPASDMDDNTDLGDRLVTVAVGALDAAAVEAALCAGLDAAERMRADGLIAGAVLVLKGEIRAVGDVPAALPNPASSGA
ncbi:MAG: UPF0280 family protein [Rhodospirillaceae bacterium]